MLTHLSTQNWRKSVLFGSLAAGFGLLSLLPVEAAPDILALLIGIALVQQTLARLVPLIWRPGAVRDPWSRLAEGGLGVLVVGFHMAWPQVSVPVILYIVAAWCVVSGMIELAFAIRLRVALPNEWSQVVGGILLVTFGFQALLDLGGGAVVFSRTAGGLAIAFGVFLDGVGLWRRHRFAAYRREAMVPSG